MKNYREIVDLLERLLQERILILDGAMGSLIQDYKLEEKDFRGERFAGHPSDLKGNNDLLSLTRPDVIEEIHRDFFNAGADIVSTNTFNANAISQADYATESLSYELNRVSAELAGRIADEITATSPDKPRLVAGSLGPTNKTASISPDVNNPGYRNITFDQLVDAYYEAARGLVDGGVDLLLPETSFDTLNIKAALFAINKLFDEGGRRVPVMASITITDRSGRTLSGQTTAAAWYSIEQAGLFSAGVNCALGADDMRMHVEELASSAHIYTSCHPNAGLPNEFGEYDHSPEYMAEVLGEFADAGWLNIVGGCCGTTPKHIKAIADRMKGVKPRIPVQVDTTSRYSGLEPLRITPESNLIMIGERTNITGSPRFAKRVREGNLEACIRIARQQVENGANMIDVNMDEGLIDSVQMMTDFLNYLATEPEIAKVPVMIDSSKWQVLEAGLKCIQGKGVVNSISLKDGEEEFKRRARLIKRYGAATIVMAMDEKGQAVTVDEKVEICKRAYRILVDDVGFAPWDIIFDPNVLTVATGLEEHNEYAINFLEATRIIKKECAHAKISGGISNLSFSFRGNNIVREAMHSSFLYHAIKAGLDMGIVNAGMLQVYDEIPKDLLEVVEDVLFNRREDSTERLLEYAKQFEGKKKERQTENASWRSQPLGERLTHALVNGIDNYTETDIDQALAEYDRAIDIIEGPLMNGMNVVGDLFGSGKMFLPQVVKSARVMKKCVAQLIPYIEEQKESGTSSSAGKVLMATVKGDVHDIGKNIVGVVLGCNNFEIIDLGVMVPSNVIIEKAKEHNVDIIGLSGLITPSLDEMVHTATEIEHEQFSIPILIGGATTSVKHTAVKIAPKYSGSTVHVLDASKAVGVAQKLLDAKSKENYSRDITEDYEKVRIKHRAEQEIKQLISIVEARVNSFKTDWSATDIAVPSFTGIQTLDDYSLAEIAEYIDWTPFFQTWELKGRYPKIFDDKRWGAQARELFADAQALLKRIVTKKLLKARAVYGFYPANSVGDDVEIYSDESRTNTLETFNFLRQQVKKDATKGTPNFCLADFIAPRDSGKEDYMGFFTVTAGIGVDELVREFEKEHDDYSAIMVKALADRLAEAFAELLHKKARETWGFGAGENLASEDLIKEKYRGIRPAPGYPACPDHTEKRKLFDLLSTEQNAGVSLTENFAMTPASSVSGYYFSHPGSRYFGVGMIDRDQVSDYQQRKAMTLKELERWLSPNLGYEPE